MRPRRWIPFAPVLLSATIATAGGPPGEPGLTRSCEPSGPLDVSARVLSRTDGRSGARVLVEVAVHSGHDLASVRIHGSAAAKGRPERRFEVSDGLTFLPRKTVRRVPYELDLEHGVEHHLYFTAHGNTPAGTLETTAYLRVNLDPAREPEIWGNRIQYRATMSGMEP